MKTISRWMLIKMAIRFLILFATVGAYVYDRNALELIFNFKPTDTFSFVYFIWLFVMADIISNFIPALNPHASSGKIHRANYQPPKNGYDETMIRTASKKSYKKSALLFIPWIIGNGIVCAYLSPYACVVLSALYFAGDMVCILFWCPFQRLIFKSRCCCTCSAFCWGYVMFCTPLLFINSFFTYSLFLTSASLFLFWEYTRFIHPERFFEQSNEALSCKNCDKTFCKMKKFAEGTFNRKLKNHCTQTHLKNPQNLS